MNPYKKLGEHFYRYIDVVGPYVKEDRATGRFYLDIIDPHHLDVSPFGFQAMSRLVEWCNGLLDKGRLVVRDGQLQLAPGASLNGLFEVPLSKLGHK